MERLGIFSNLPTLKFKFLVNFTYFGIICEDLLPVRLKEKKSIYLKEFCGE